MIKSATVEAQVQWGISYWEVDVYDEQGKCFNTIQFPLEIAKRKGVTKRLNGTKKLHAWLNSKEGLDYLNEKWGG